ncbi:reverse transcriptase domain-containing protein [Tanacetum coccineum]
MPILHSFEENELEYEDEDEVEIKMMGIGMDKESLEHNLYKDDITLIICHNFSLTLSPPIKPKDSGNFRMKVYAVVHIGNNLEDQTNIRLSLASHSHIYPLGIAEDMLVEVAEHVYPTNFIIIDIKENEKRPFILGMPFLTMTKASIKFNTSTITLRSGKSKISLNRIPEPLSHVEKGIKNDIEPIVPTMTVNRLILEWEEDKTSSRKGWNLINGN